MQMIINNLLKNAKGIFKVENEIGIDSRLALRIVHLSKKYPATNITIISKKKVVDAKSIIDIMTLAATKGTRLIVTANGREAQKVVKEIGGGGLFDQEQDCGNNFFNNTEARTISLQL